MKTMEERQITEADIARINELYHKAKAAEEEGGIPLTEEERREQALLRKAYIDSVRRNLRAQLDRIDIEEADGSVTNLGEQHRMSAQ